MKPSTCGWIVVDRRDFTVPMNSLVRSTGGVAERHRLDGGRRWPARVRPLPAAAARRGHRSGQQARPGPEGLARRPGYPVLQSSTSRALPT